MYILTSTYGCPIVVIPKTHSDIEKFLSVRGATEISKGVFEQNKENLSSVALTREDGYKINEFVGDCECWQVKNRKRLSV